MLKHKLLSASAAVPPIFIEDVFSTYLYTGSTSATTITNNIDLSGEGGLVWMKSRAAASHHLVDTERGVGYALFSDQDYGNIQDSGYITAFSSNGFTIGANESGINENGISYASWTFRQAERFFDVVTYTGTGANRTIAHDLGVVPGCIIVKRTNTTGNWQVYHRSLANTQYLVLNSTAAAATGATRWNSTTPTSTVFSLGTDATVNASGGTYVAYLFAHDPLGPSGDGSDGLIACGSVTGVPGGLATVDLGWEPQWLLIKPNLGTEYWYLTDSMRGLPASTSSPNYLQAQVSNAETVGGVPDGITSRGFTLFNRAASSYLYIAIRRGPMREPTSGTEVFSPNAVNVSTGTAITTGFPVDLQIFSLRTGTTNKNNVYDRLRGVSTNTTESGLRLITNSTATETAGNETRGWDNTGFKMTSTFSSTSDIFWNFRRAPGFFDMVAHTGTGSPIAQNHNLTVLPELIITKARTNAGGQMNWYVGHYGLNQYATSISTAPVNNTNLSTFAPVTTTTFVPLLNTNTGTFISYLFASLPGISKVGSYTGNGSNQTINCGFTGGARFVLIKRTDSTGDWYVWDTARGIVAGNDPHLSLNTTAAEVTTNDSIDPDSSGFIVNQLAATNINVSSATYIYLAIA